MQKTEGVNWCLSMCLPFAVALRARGCYDLAVTLFKPPAAHFVRTKCAKALRGHPLKSPFYGVRELARSFSKRHTLEETSLRLPRSHAPAY